MIKRKLLKKLLSGSRDIRFSEAASVAEAFGFKLDRKMAVTTYTSTPTFRSL